MCIRDRDADMVSYSIGEDEVDRHVVVYKKEYVPSEEVLNVLRRGEEMTEEKAKQLAEKVNILSYIFFYNLIASETTCTFQNFAEHIFFSCCTFESLGFKLQRESFS